jgi:hypothetical protein
VLTMAHEAEQSTSGHAAFYCFHACSRSSWATGAPPAILGVEADGAQADFVLLPKPTHIAPIERHPLGAHLAGWYLCEGNGRMTARQVLRAPVNMS